MIKIYNSLERKKVDFQPLEEGKVSIYLCGPTVYDIPHLGHGRSATSFDVIRRYFEYRGFDVNFVSNYTDIDDKMIGRAAEEGLSVAELAAKVIPEYERDYSQLGIKPPSVQPKATDHIPEILSLIEMLEENGFTYSLEDGVYFDVAKFDEYGKLSGQKLEDLRMGARVEVNESKRNPYDFALWKFKKEGEPFWASKWGDGRPGWHIECSAMSWKHLGDSFDIHGGGLDLTFPHHECELAQTECALGRGTFAKYWIHNGFINVDNEKMSKSLGNFSTLRDIFQKYDPKVVRFMFMQTHYRNPINFSDVLLEQSKAALDRVHGFLQSVESLGEDGDYDFSEMIDVALEEFQGSMDDDFDSSGALAALFSLITAVNKKIKESAPASLSNTELLGALKKLDSVLGVIFVEKEDLDNELLALIAERDEARKNKDYARSDEIRDLLLDRRIELEDHPEGTRWKRV